MQRIRLVLLGVIALLALTGPAALAAPAQVEPSAAVQKAAAWIASQQQPDGSFPGFGVGSTADALYALVAAGHAGNPRAAGGATAIDYLANKAADYAKTPGAAAKLILAIGASGETQDLHNFGGVDLLKVLSDNYDPNSGHYGKDVTGQALTILALFDAKQPIPPSAVTWLINAQGSEGGWAFDGSTGPGSADTNTTGLALQALAAAGNLPAATAQKALAYLHIQQNADGGFAYQNGNGSASDANSTGMVVMGLIAAGQNPEDASWKTSGHSPLDFLRGLQNASGALRYQADQAKDDAGATYQAVPALIEIALPVEQWAHIAAPGSPQPGMPTTGHGVDLPGLLAGLLAALTLIALGAHLRGAATQG